MCCGGGRRVANTKPKAQAKAMEIPGANSGMVILEYNGKSAGDMTWRGPVTQAIYVLGGVTKRQYIDVKDAGERPSNKSDGKGMLALREGNRWLFKVYEVPKVEVVQDEIIEMQEEVSFPNINPDEMTVSNIRDLLSEYHYSKAEILEALETEQAGKNRKTVVNLLEDALG